MNYEECRKVIKKFLKSKELQVLSFSGHWGIGKTYLWDSIKKELKPSDLDKDYKYYSYTSLFGVNSVNDFNRVIQSNCYPMNEDKHKNICRRIMGWSQRTFKTATAIAEANDYAKILLGIAEGFISSSLNHYLICIDDFERKSENINYKDIMGVISDLKEKRNCKIIIIHHEENIGDKDYKVAKEKVVDVELRLNPTFEESVSIIFDKEHPMLIKNIKNLNITNIRTLKKIKRFYDYLHPFLENRYNKILEQICHSLPLIVYSHSNQMDISLNDLETLQTRFLEHPKGEKGEELRTKQSFLRNYGWALTDEFDKFLIKLVKYGLLPDSEIITQFYIKNGLNYKEELALEYFNAWDEYNFSFDVDEEKFLQRIKTTFNENIENISISDLNSTYSLFNDLGMKKEAEEIVEKYKKGHKHNNLDFMYIKDPQLSELMISWLDSNKSKTIPYRKLFLEIGEGRGWNPEDVEALSEIPEDELYNLIHMNPDKAHFEAIKFFLFYREKGGYFEIIGTKIEEVLKKIAATADINKRRIENIFGVSQKKIGEN